MSDAGGRTEKGAWTTPYVQAGGVHALSGAALAGIARAVLSRGRPFRFHALGGSMSPFIRDGDVITLVPPDAAGCAPGRVVAVAQPENGRMVVHRVIGVSGGRCRTQGDNNSVADGEVPLACIIGTVACVERGGRRVRFGLGPEGIVIALLSRRRWLPACMGAARAVSSTVRRFS